MQRSVLLIFLMKKVFFVYIVHREILKYVFPNAAFTVANIFYEKSIFCVISK